MDWKTHLAGGIIAAAIGMVAIGGTGRLQMLDIFVWTALFALVPCVPGFLGHRGRTPLTHSLFAPLVLFACLALLSFLPLPSLYGLISPTGALFASLGLASHALLDSFTSNGAPLLYPLVGRRHLHFPWFGARLRYDDDISHNALQVVAVLVCAAALLIDLIGRIV
jgi:membrane-bound metal-dependent hydrolase YbcI (DUF457 family)